MKTLKKVLGLTLCAVVFLISSVSVGAETIYTVDGYSYTLIDSSRACLVGWDNRSDCMYIPNKLGDVYMCAIGNSAFKDDNFIKSIDLTDTQRLNTIGNYAFANSILEGMLTIPIKVSNIGVAAFENCKNITSIQYSSNGGIVSAQCFKGCSSLEVANLTSHINRIDAYAFENCTSLKEVTIPSSVTDINSNAFNGCGEFVIKGYRDSYAQQFAKDKGLDFYILDPLYGDSNADGKVNILDVTAIQKYKIGEQELSEYGMRCADVNHDGSITVRDATLIQMKLAKYDVDF